MSVFHLPPPTFVGGAQPFAPPIRRVPPAATAFSASLEDIVSTFDALSSSPAGWIPRNLASLPSTQAIVWQWWAPPVIGQITSAPTPPLGINALADTTATSDAYVLTGQFSGSLSDTATTSDLYVQTNLVGTLADTVATSDSFIAIIPQVPTGGPGDGGIGSESESRRKWLAWKETQARRPTPKPKPVVAAKPVASKPTAQSSPTVRTSPTVSIDRASITRTAGLNNLPSDPFTLGDRLARATKKP